MEGSIGVYDKNSPPKNLLLMRKEISFILSKLIEHKFNISVIDCHDNGKNLNILKTKFPQVRFFQHLGNFDETYKKEHLNYDCALLTGFHVKNGSLGIYPHSFRLDIENIYMGLEMVGEAEIIINYLSFFNIPTIFLSGDKDFIDEMSNYTCKKTIVKPKINDAYNKICADILSALSNNNDFNKTITYNDSPIYIKLRNDSSLRYFPLNDFRIEDERLIFSDTLDFIENLMPVCYILNSAINILKLKLRKLIFKINKKYTYEQLNNIKDTKLRTLLLYGKKIYDFTDEDIVYIEKLLLL